MDTPQKIYAPIFAVLGKQISFNFLLQNNLRKLRWN